MPEYETNAYSWRRVEEERFLRAAQLRKLGFPCCYHFEAFRQKRVLLLYCRLQLLDLTVRPSRVRLNLGMTVSYNSTVVVPGEIPFRGTYLTFYVFFSLNGAG